MYMGQVQKYPNINIKVEDGSNYDISNSFVYLQSNCASFFPLAKTVNIVVKCVTDYSNDHNNTRELYDKQSVPNEISDDGTNVSINVLIMRYWCNVGYGPRQDSFEDIVRNSVCHCAVEYYRKFGGEYHISPKTKLDNLPNPIILVIKDHRGIELYIGEIILIDEDIRKGGIIQMLNGEQQPFLFSIIDGAFAIDLSEINQDKSYEND